MITALYIIIYFRSRLLALTGAMCRAERQAGPGGSDVISGAAGGRFRSAHGLPSPAAPRSRDRVLGARQEPEFPQRAARPPRTLHDAGARSDVAMLGVARFLQSRGLRKVAQSRPISISDVWFNRRVAALEQPHVNKCKTPSPFVIHAFRIHKGKRKASILCLPVYMYVCLSVCPSVCL